MKKKTNEQLSTLNVCKTLHARVKLYCNKQGLKVRFWVEKTIEAGLKEEK